jgi:CRP-like cAMP-binding protein
MAKTTMPQCHNCRILDRTVWGSLTDDALDTLAGERVASRYQKGDVIFHEGTPCTGLYNVCTGKVKLVRTGRGGRQTIVRMSGPGRTLAERDLFQADGRHSVTAQAMEDTVVCFLGKTPLMEHLRAYPDMMFDMVRRLADALTQAEERVESLATQDARHRLAGFLLDLAREEGEPDGEATRIKLRLTREEVAEVIGATLETTIRLMSAFKKEGIAKDDDGHIVLLDLPRLGRILGARVDAPAGTRARSG